MLIGYARVSTSDQNTELQKNALVGANCELIFEDHASGKNARRPGLKRALRKLKRGDTLIVWKLDRLGRSVRDLITMVSDLQAHGIHFRSLTDAIDTTTPAGRFFFHVMSALAEMERELIVERTRAGLAAARAAGRIGGRRRIMTPDAIEHAKTLLTNGATRWQIANIIGVSEKTIYKYFPVTQKTVVSELLSYGKYEG
ncbi:recombinase family protein [Dickeya solani]|uniref:DNA-invertase n=1 Tax=Dickeya solani D s0432-1 TaxID=1231725 RepID=A0AAV3K5U1_9GAMM|nr:recombinase family protein [Dickeya solani]ANE73866.1 DNA-invertase [Dickeya solani IPO 2222]AUC40968.1 DNA-invertase [Dickeya solani RNS 08.23.3.1.A]AUH10716.1 DNA-invertase [Dickeya solani D s0432-1]AUH14642.1 DNA-invertase [Dickeya solani]AYQ48271.1 DNA-invertase hin [Dickeya solani]